MPGNNETFEGMRPSAFERGRHLACGLPCPNNDCPAFRRIRKMANQGLVRIGGLDGLVKQGLQESSWIGNQTLLHFQSSPTEHLPGLAGDCPALGRVSFALV